MSWIDSHKFADVIFGITQKLLYIKSSNWSDNIQPIKEFFWTCFVTWRATDY